MVIAYNEHKMSPFQMDLQVVTLKTCALMTVYPTCIPSDDEYDEGDDLAEELKGVEHTQAGKFLFRMAIPEVFYKYIIGKQGKTKSMIEKDTGCRIQVPNRGRKGDVSKSVRSVAVSISAQWSPS